MVIIIQLSIDGEQYHFSYLSMPLWMLDRIMCAYGPIVIMPTDYGQLSRGQSVCQ